ncbi:ABC transporter permease [Desulfofustis glycolicus]|uniref:ABC-2 type transport system permease protein n=1 Tax=Desulfofustis glycolicus DSM 9705 TaxID=1121409 RepID=A0A1M5X0M0_9BACT|nr:ABC transporter permease [Desulfofustis glycolicus]MCB2218642.1 ABC transporter permease [Desulfobulbaceae bacterium]SHH93078.1 ABC-2 type transport system permease protein [Desulfofustis glycolicus DSM 9705]
MKGKLLFLMRLRGILQKETLQILRDPSSIALAIVMPMVLLFLFGYGVTLDADHIPTALVDDDGSSVARELIARFDLSPNFELLPTRTMAEAEELIRNRTAHAIIRLQSDFSAQMLSGQEAPVQLIVNGIDANRARLIQGYVRTALGNWSSMRLARGETAGLPAVMVSPRVWFNESTESRNFIIPGLITLIMTLIGILLTALVVAREWERGTMEALLVTPLRRIEILIGKIFPYYILGMLGMGMSVLVAILVFQVPFRGSVPALLLFSSLFMLASLGFGLLLSAAIRIQFVAAQVSIVAGFLPAFFLSGLIFDLESTPLPIQVISHIVPARYFVDISHTLFMAGDVWPVLVPGGLVLAAMAIIFLRLAYGNITKRLEK